MGVVQGLQGAAVQHRGKITQHRRRVQSFLVEIVSIFMKPVREQPGGQPVGQRSDWACRERQWTRQRRTSLQKRQRVPCGTQRPGPVKAVDVRCRPADRDPHTPRPVAGCIGERKVLRSRETRFRQLQRRKAVAFVRVHHELTPHCHADRASAQQHPSRHHCIEAGDAAVLLGHPGGQLEIAPWVIEEDLAEVGLASCARAPALFRIYAC